MFKLGLLLACYDYCKSNATMLFLFYSLMRFICSCFFFTAQISHLFLGTYLRRNPIARGLFLLYLMMLHLWTLGLLIFHSHRYEVVHGDFGHGATGVHPQTGRLVPGALSP